MKPVRILIAVLAAAALAAAATPRSDAAGATSGLFALDVAGHNVGPFADFSVSESGAVLRGVTATPALRAWALGQKRADLDVVMYGAKGDPVARYHLENAWPTKIEIGAVAGQILSITLCHEGLEIQ
jgi:hypothetical protein